MGNRTNYQKKWIKDNIIEVRRQNTEWRRQHRESAKNFYVKATYGLTLDEYQARVDLQGGVCAICNKLLTPGRGSHLDHCHETGKIRGFLCPACNKGLGHFQDSPELLQTAIHYLNYHKENS